MIIICPECGRIKSKHAWKIAFALFLAIFALMVLFAPALASTICLTKKEARQLWPRQHIYWYSKNRCWSNRRGPPRNLKMDPIINSHAQIPSKQQVFDKRPAARQDKIIDMDKWRAENCCWPDFPRDDAGNIIEPFVQRADPVPFGWWSKTYEK